MIRIDPNSVGKLVTALRTTTSSPNNLEYDKEKTSWSDILDAFLQLSLVLQNKGYRYTERLNFPNDNGAKISIVVGRLTF
jgi:hypothetical protein